MLYIVNRISPLGVRDYLLVTFVIFMVSGNTSSSYLYISIGLFLLWFFLSLLSSKLFFKTLVRDKKIRYLFIYLLYSFLCGLIGGTIDFSVKQLLGGLLLFSPIIINDYYKLDKYHNRLNTVIIICLLGWCYYAVKAIAFYLIFPGAARVLASNNNAFGDISIGGGYSLAYGSVFIALIGVNLLVDRRLKHFFYYIFWCIIVLLCTSVVILTNSTTTTVTYVFCVVLCLLFRNPHDNPREGVGLSSKNIPKLMFAFLFLIILALSIKSIGRELVEIANQTESKTYQDRLASLGYSLQGKGDEYTEGRTSIPLNAFMTFLKNPIFGVCYKHGNGFKSSEDAGLGNHCEWSDALANLGFIIGTLFLLIYARQVKDVTIAKNKFSFAWIVALLIMGTFNPLRSFQSHLALFFLLPAIARLEVYSKFINSQKH